MKLRDLDSMDAMLDEHFSNDKGIKSGAKQMGREVSADKRQRIGSAMRGKTLEDMLGVERAAKGRKTRAVAATGKQDPTVGQKRAATRKANGSYQSPTHGMNGKEHKESTKAIMQIKAKIRQDLKRKLNMGREGKLSKELLEAEYKKAGLK